MNKIFQIQKDTPTIVSLTVDLYLWHIITKSVNKWTVVDMKPSDSYFFLIRNVLSKGKGNNL